MQRALPVYACPCLGSQQPCSDATMYMHGWQLRRFTRYTRQSSRPTPQEMLHIAVIIYICLGQQRAMALSGLAACQRVTPPSSELVYAAKTLGAKNPVSAPNLGLHIAGTPEEKGLESCILNQARCTGRWMPPHTHKCILLPTKPIDSLRHRADHIILHSKSLAPRPRACTQSGMHKESQKELSVQQHSREAAARSAHAANPSP